MDFLFTARRDRTAAGRFLERAIGQHGEPEKITIDKSGANTAAIDSYNAGHEVNIEMRQCKYLTDVFDKTFWRCRAIFLLARVTAWPRAGVGMQAGPAA